MPARLRDFPAHDSLALAADRAASGHREREFRAIEDGLPIGPTYVSSFGLPFAEWRLLTATPRSDFAAEIDRGVRKVLLGVGGLVLLASATALLFAHLLFTRPFHLLSAQLLAVERFALDQVRHQPTFLAELDDFSWALKRMAVGIAAFARYMPLDVVKPLVAAGIEPVPDAKLQEITVLFADLPGFTSAAERLGADVQPYLTSFLTLAVQAIHAEGGTVDKFIGDAVMAIWNAPEPIDGHALRACRAARAIHAAMHALPLLQAGSHDGTRVRIGINTGTALVGNIGSDERLSYTAIGDTVNLASRLVGIAKEHGVEVVASGMTIAHAGSQAGGRLQAAIRCGVEQPRRTSIASSDSIGPTFAAVKKRPGHQGQTVCFRKPEPQSCRWSCFSPSGPWPRRRPDRVRAGRSASLRVASRFDLHSGRPAFSNPSRRCSASAAYL